MKSRNELENVLLDQFKLYPNMEIQDMIKLIYQNEFAGEHAIQSEKKSLKWLERECKELGEDEISNPFEEIGNGLCRLHLRGILNSGIEIRTVNKFFVDTANSIDGDIQRFEAKLEILRGCCQSGALPYEVKDLDLYLDEYRSLCYPPVSHSKTYRAHYSPAYRIVNAKYCHYLELFERIDTLLKQRNAINVAIDGNAGAGKTTLATLIENIYDCNVFHMDHFFLKPEQRTKERLSEVGGNIDYMRFKHEVIKGLQSGEKFKYQVFDCKKMSLDRKVEVEPKALNIIEGVYSMHPALIDNYDLKIFLEIDKDEQARRILQRNGPKMQNRFLKEWIPLEERYFKKLRIKQRSDLILKSCPS